MKSRATALSIQITSIVKPVYGDHPRVLKKCCLKNIISKWDLGWLLLFLLSWSLLTSGYCSEVVNKAGLTSRCALLKNRTKVNFNISSFKVILLLIFRSKKKLV